MSYYHEQIEQQEKESNEAWRKTFPKAESSAELCVVYDESLCNMPYSLKERVAANACSGKCYDEAKR